MHINVSLSAKFTLETSLPQCWSFAYCHPFVEGARFANDVTAPVKLATASFSPSDTQCIVTTPTTECLAVIDAFTGTVAQPSRSSGRIVIRVRVAETGRPLEIKEFI